MGAPRLDGLSIAVPKDRTEVTIPVDDAVHLAFILDRLIEAHKQSISNFHHMGAKKTAITRVERRLRRDQGLLDRLEKAITE